MLTLHGRRDQAADGPTVLKLGKRWRGPVEPFTLRGRKCLRLSCGGVWVGRVRPGRASEASRGWGCPLVSPPGEREGLHVRRRFTTVTVRPALAAMATSVQ